MLAGLLPGQRIAALYVVLAHLTPSPVVELNRAVAVGMAYGADRGLALTDKLVGERALFAARATGLATAKEEQ